MIPINLNGDVCVLNTQVQAPTREGWGVVRFAAGPCQSGLKLAVSPNAAKTGYTLDHFFAATQTFVVPLQIAMHRTMNTLLDDGVLHTPVVVRLDIIAKKPR
jgi:hypothetical protein